MTDYSKLINDLHNAANFLNEAANTIEALSKKSTRKKPPKRLPCLCGRKQLDTWATGDPDGWFLKCPNCGIKSKVVRYQCDLNAAWNEKIKEKGKE